MMRIAPAIDSFKTALTAVLCLWLGHRFSLAHSYWAAISAIIVMGSDAGVTLTSCRDRPIGTAIGALLGWGTSYVWRGHTLLYGLSVALCILICSALQFHKAGPPRCSGTHHRRVGQPRHHSRPRSPSQAS
jgi:uncharacterized membrane protein YgaE (UPF0421/DUF939 family)